MVALLEVNEVIARAIKTQLVNLVLHILPLDFCFLLAVWNQECKVVDEVPKVPLDTALCDHEHPLSVFPLPSLFLWVLEGSQLVFRVVTNYSIGHFFHLFLSLLFARTFLTDIIR